MAVPKEQTGCSSASTSRLNLADPRFVADIVAIEIIISLFPEYALVADANLNPVNAVEISIGSSRLGHLLSWLGLSEQFRAFR
ncbi:hypothetical protein [Rhizobium jaguaris]|uniref:Uncharacterized protein n=1 Tax=Rhizobium jaguaris TaxID=1312183 RepID=A0A387FZV2_9HYPH|nr:hypothetical protein [Rhizobium jaguaris]AYG64189.1 hypothetical protein CCGE525_36220 [Rhizobium jaguaris]